MEKGSRNNRLNPGVIHTPPAIAAVLYGQANKLFTSIFLLTESRFRRRLKTCDSSYPPFNNFTQYLLPADNFQLPPLRQTVAEGANVAAQTELLISLKNAHKSILTIKTN